jgi:hypothetical protein
VNDIKTDHKEIGKMGGAVDWIYLAQNINKLRIFVKAVMNFLFSYNAGTFLTDRRHVTFPKKFRSI